MNIRTDQDASAVSADHRTKPPEEADDPSLTLSLATFTAGNLARPLLAFDEATPDTHLQQAMKQSQLPVVGLMKDGRVAGWRSQDELRSGIARTCDRPFRPETVVEQAASFQEVIARLERSSWLFVRSFQQVNGVILIADVDRPPMRMWLFGLITAMELRLNRLISDLLPNDEWTRHLSAGRNQKAHELQQVCRKQGEERSLMDCLQFSDKGRIVSRDPRLMSLTRFQSKREVEEFAFKLQMLRNKLAHSLPLSGEWQTVVELAGNLSRIVSPAT